MDRETIEDDSINGLKGRAQQALNALTCKDKRLRSTEEAIGHLGLLVRGLENASLVTHHSIPQLSKDMQIHSLGQSEGKWFCGIRTVHGITSAYGRTPREAVINALDRIDCTALISGQSNAGDGGEG